MPSKYPKLTNGHDTMRPFRLYDPVSKTLLPHRYYKFPFNAHRGALIEVGWAKPGMVVELIDITTGQLLGQYKRTATDIELHAIRRHDDGKAE